MDIDDSLKAQEAWAIESFQEIKGQGIPTRVIKLMKDINSEARKVAYRGSGIKKYERLREDCVKLYNFPARGVDVPKEITRYLSDMTVKHASYRIMILRSYIGAVQATAQNIIGIMDQLKDLKKSNPQTVFIIKSKSLYAKAEKYATSLIDILKYARVGGADQRSDFKWDIYENAVKTERKRQDKERGRS